jgi:hypothetical protein
MIDFGKILKRAWYILWNYKVLWIFGILLALTTGGGNRGNNSNYQFNGNDTQTGNGYDMREAGPMMRELADWFTKDVVPVFEHPTEHVATLIWIGVALFLFILIVSIIAAFIRYPSEVAVMRMVDGYEANGEKVGFRAGWKLGWNRRAFRLWVIDLIISLPGLVFVALLLILVVVFFINTADATHTPSVSLVITTVGCLFLLVFAFIILMVFLGLLREFFARFVALEETGVGESLSQAWAFFKRNWKSAAVMWLIMLGIGIGFGIAGIIVFFVLIPVYLVLLIPAVLVAAIPGLIAYGIASIFVSGPLAWIIGAIFALPVFFTILLAPLFLFGGWYQVYASNVWTLTYREMKLMNDAPVAQVPEVPAQSA